MAGYYNIRLAEGAHDELYAKAVVLEYEGTKAALVVCDLVGLEAEIVAEARQQIERGSGIAPERVMISATHSHTGPLLRKKFLANAPPQALAIAKQYLAALPGKIAESVRQADAALAPARLSFGLGHEESISFNRRYLMKDGTVGWNPGKLNPNIVQPMGPIDPDVAVLYADTTEGKPLAAYVNFAMHLDTVGGMQFSADYPYTLARLLAKLKGPDLLTVFSTGACGNINHVDVRTKEPQKGPGEAERIGTVLAGEVLKTLTRLRRVPSGPIRARSETLQLQARAIEAGDVEKARDVAARFGKPNAAPFLDQVKAFRVLEVNERDGRPIPAEVQAIALGPDLAWVALPGEIFTELGTAVKKASPFPHTIVVELANGNVGYVPDRRAYPQGAYEVVSTRLSEGGGEAMVESALRLLEGLKKSAK